MLCENCGEREANVHLSHVVNDAAREAHLCEECAAKSGLNIQGPLSLAGVLFDLGATATGEGEAREKSCAFCFRKGSLLGCPVCYESFGPELNPILADMHRGSRHVGKTPASFAGEQAEDPATAALQNELQTAISAENYEEAARLRDRICAAKASGERQQRLSGQNER